MIQYRMTGARVFLIVMDSVGIGAMPDAHLYGDEGSNTLGNLSRAVGGLRLPALESLGLGLLGDFQGIARHTSPRALFGTLEELSRGKDTITGHWEMMGIVSDRAFPTYPGGFPPDVIEAFERAIGRMVLWNRPASGTEIIERLGDEHMRTGRPIVYTSADSVFQIAAHEDVIPVEELYAICRAARDLLVSPHNVCRVIARPFIGPPYKRTYRRRDFPLDPPEETALDIIARAGCDVLSVGKVWDMFSGRGFTGSIKTSGNADAYLRLDDILKATSKNRFSFTKGCPESFARGLVFCNLVDFDTAYGHRNDAPGYARALEELDLWLASALPRFGPLDWLILTADHGCDPTTPGTDHSREYVPVLLYNPNIKGRALGTLKGFAHIGATVTDILDVKGFGKASSLLGQTG